MGLASIYENTKINYSANKNKISSAVDEIVYYTMNKSLGLVTFQEVLLLSTGQVPLQMLLGLNLEKSFGAGGERGSGSCTNLFLSFGTGGLGWNERPHSLLPSLLGSRAKWVLILSFSVNLMLAVFLMSF